MTRSIVLIGPPATGKSTVAEQLARLTRMPTVDADDVSFPYYEQCGWRAETFNATRDDLGWTAFQEAFAPALTHAVERLLADHPGHIISLGAGHTHVEDEGLFDRVRQALDTHRVVLLRPSADPAASVRILRERCVQTKWTDWHLDGVDWLERWCTDGRDEQLATATVYTEHRTPEQTAQQIRAITAAA